VVGRFEVSFVGDWSAGSRLALVNTRIREALRRAAERVMPVPQAALFTGLVIGDDLRQPTATVQSFRAAGLSHLTAVSGQNVAFVLAAASPLLRRLRAGPRWTVTVGLVVWFMALTRFEPSVLRAGFMAILAATAFVLGRRQHPLRLLCLTVMVLVLIDPLLVWSVGFWLSAGATGGVIVVGPRLAQRLPGPGWFTTPLGITLGAQVGVALPSLLVFGRLPLVSVPANLLAVPVGGFVMLYGLPAGLVAAALPPIDSVVMFPAVVGTRWVETVAALAPRFEPAPRWTLPGWCAIGVIVGVLARRSRDSSSDVPI
jgi:competence protein ComEC